MSSQDFGSSNQSSVCGHGIGHVIFQPSGNEFQSVPYASRNATILHGHDWAFHRFSHVSLNFGCIRDDVESGGDGQKRELVEGIGGSLTGHRDDG